MDAKYVFHILVDDAHGDYFFKILLNEPEVMPTIKKYIFDNGAYSKNCLASYVASSIPGHTVLLTGVFPDRNKVPYAWFWDVKENPPQKIDLSKISISTIKKWNKAISQEIQTNFEHFPNSASFTIISRGAKHKFFTIWKIIYAFILLKIKRVDVLEERLGFWEYMYMSQLKKFMKKVKKKGLAPYTFIVYPPSDSAAHEDGFESQEYRDALNLLDRVLKLLIEGDHTNPKKKVLGLKDLGLLDDCMFVICSDHSSQKFDKLHDILADVRKLPLNIVSVNDPKIKKSTVRAADVLVAPGCGIYMFYVRDPNTGKFASTISVDLLHSYQAEKGNSPIDLLKPILDAEGTARVYIRTGEDTILVLIPDGSELLIERKRDADNIAYKCKLDGKNDPFGYLNDPKAKVLMDETFHSASEWFENTYHTQYPFQVDQIFRYLDCSLAGTVLAEAKKGWNFVAPGLEDAEEKVQNHDTCDRDETMVPLIISGQGIKKGYEIPYCRNVDIIPTFLEWLGVEYDPSLLDGRVLKQILE